MFFSIDWWLECFPICHQRVSVSLLEAKFLPDQVRDLHAICTCLYNQFNHRPVTNKFYEQGPKFNECPVTCSSRSSSFVPMWLALSCWQGSYDKKFNLKFKSFISAFELQEIKIMSPALCTTLSSRFKQIFNQLDFHPPPEVKQHYAIRFSHLLSNSYNEFWFIKLKAEGGP